jgi:hypothetical protein
MPLGTILIGISEINDTSARKRAELGVVFGGGYVGSPADPRKLPSSPSPQVRRNRLRG